MWKLFGNSLVMPFSFGTSPPTTGDRPKSLVDPNFYIGRDQIITALPITPFSPPAPFTPDAPVKSAFSSTQGTRSGGEFMSRACQFWKRIGHRLNCFSSSTQPEQAAEEIASKPRQNAGSGKLHRIARSIALLTMQVLMANNRSTLEYAAKCRNSKRLPRLKSRGSHQASTRSQARPNPFFRAPL